MTNNPFVTNNYDYSWKELRERFTNLTEHFNGLFKLAYHNDYYEKIVMLVHTGLDHDVKDALLIYINKLDASKEHSLLSFETKKYNGDIKHFEDYVEGDAFMHQFLENFNTLAL